MPASAIVAGAGGVISMGTSLIGAIGAGKKAKEVEKQIENYQRQTLENPYANLQVSTAGADLQRADIARSVATGIDKLALGGSRALIGGSVNMIDQQIAQEQKIASDLDQQYNQNEQLKAQGEGLVQNMQERREEGDLQGLGNALNTYRQEKANNINQFATGAMSTAIGVSGAIENDKMIKSLKPSGKVIDVMSGVSQGGATSQSSGGSSLMDYLKLMNGNKLGSSVYNTKFNPNLR